MEREISRQLLDFLNASPSCYHVIDRLSVRLREAGYRQLWETQPWNVEKGGKYFVTRGDSTLAAFRVPEHDFHGFLLAAGHSDVPTLKVREAAEESAPGGCIRLSVEPYGGMIMRSWLDRPLSVAGRVMVRNGDTICSRLVNIDRDLLVIPSVAIHMDREVNKGTALKANTDLLPLFAMGTEQGRFRRLIAEAVGVTEENLLSTDLFLYPRTAATLVGVDGEFVAGHGLDDRQCVFGCFKGFLDAEDSVNMPVFCVFNNEEVGSGTRQGADSTFLTDVLSRICENLGITGEAYRTVMANSFLVSADNAHAIHPAHPEYADKNEFPVLNGGVVIKYNASQHYTTDALSGAVFSQICKRAEVPVQRYSNRADLPGGSTLGNISSAHLSVPAVDIGLPQLAMHSSYELAGARDTAALVRAMANYFGSELYRLPDGSFSI